MVNEIYIEDVRENPDLCEEMEKLLEFSENQEFAVAICIGHKAVTKAPHEKDFGKIKRLF